MLKEIIERLMDPGASSPLVPLLAVFVVFVGIFGTIIFLVGKMLRTPEAGEDDDTVPESVLGLLREESAVRIFFRRLGERFRRRNRRGRVSQEVTDSEQDYLRDKIDRLERENIHIRDLHVESLREMAAAKFRTDAIEIQLKEAIEEVERLYKSNAELVGQKTSPLPASDLTEVVLKQTHTIDKMTGDIRRLTEENEKLRSLLLVCRTQIVEMLNQQPTPKSPAAASAK
jgi:hypothetical protein